MSITIVTGMETFDDVKTLAISLTEKERARITEKVAKLKEVPVRSEFATELMEAWKSADFGCQTVHVANFLHHIIKAVTKEDIDFVAAKKGSSETEPMNKGGIVHIQGLGVMMFIDGSGHTMKGDGHNMAPTLVLSKYNPSAELKTGEWQFATSTEIDEYFKRLSSQTYSSLSEIIGYFERS